MRFKFIPQASQFDCGPACLAMIMAYYRNDATLKFIRDNCFVSREGVSLLDLEEVANRIGFDTYSGMVRECDINNDMLPCILHWNQNHFVVLRKVKISPRGRKMYKIIDPGYGVLKITEEDFKKSWTMDGAKGILMLLDPTIRIFNTTIPNEQKASLKLIFNYLNPYRRKLFYIFCMLVFGTLTTLAFPILTQRLIDQGVEHKNINIIFYILLAQLFFYFGNITFQMIRNAIMLKMGTKINIKIVSDFLTKILKLPISFFDSKMIGDFRQRIQDQERIERFLTSDGLLTFFSSITFLVFFGVLWYYNYLMMLIYFFLTLFSVFWSLYWLKKRMILDYFRFQLNSKDQEIVYEIINGVTEMKLNQFESTKKKDWKLVQEKIYETNVRLLKINQFLLSGFNFINQVKNIIVTFVSAYLVVHEEMTIGALLSVSYIIGEMNSPVSQLVSFFQSSQDAKLSLARLNDIQNQKEEEIEGLQLLNVVKPKIRSFVNSGISLANVSYRYGGGNSNLVLKNINMQIPEGSTTAIVGVSGSGKTTLIKLLLRFYDPTDGTISFEGNNITNLSPLDLRKNCGVVMQDGYIFSDSIERNIAMRDEKEIDYKRLEEALKIANIYEFVHNLPLGLKTKIGSSGNGLSGGQKQRLLVARAIYKNPKYIFLDEATSSLDAENERVIYHNLRNFFKGRTVIVIAHRLSTVREADQIVVLDRGSVAESGTHSQLINKKTVYYKLIKNQLELGT